MWHASSALYYIPQCASHGAKAQVSMWPQLGGAEAPLQVRRSAPMQLAQAEADAKGAVLLKQSWTALAF